MRPISLLELCDVLQSPGGEPARSVGGNPRVEATGASIDTRTIAPGDLFFALPGSQQHGIDHAAQALRAGAAAIVTTAELCGRVQGASLVVDDPRAALGRLADFMRQSECPGAVAITGSVGKTTTCGYLAQILGDRVQVHRPPGSFNNDLGVPLTILNAPESCELLICEVGTNAPGEIKTLGSWVRPQVACITAVGPAHLEGFGSIERIEEEKLSLLETLTSNGVGCAPASLLAKYPGLDLRAPVVTFGAGGELEVVRHRHAPTLSLHWRPEGMVLPVAWDPPAPHAIHNLEAVLAICVGLGYPLEELLDGIARLQLPPLRGEEEEHAGVRFRLDCYNSNPVSLESAIVRLATEPCDGRKVCVLGAMDELGADEEVWHERLGRLLGRSKLDQVYLVGRGSEWYRRGLQATGNDGVTIVDDRTAAHRLAEELAPGDQVLFKASRSVALERFARRVARVLEAD
ncbi:MAG: UDP-N-acetylmuramoyl-tripeptide--D-alanyl-D-alanine ligase [Planctomycetota bacterium]